MDFLGVKIVNFKRRMETGPLILRLCRLRDLRTLHPLFMPEILPKPKTSGSRPRSLFSFYRWIKSTFQVIYVIEIAENGAPRVIGVAGVYDMELGEKLRLSLAIFNPEDRGRGYGGKALSLLLCFLQEMGAAKVVYAEILRNNVPALRLCSRLGFAVKRCYQDTLLLEKDPKR